MKLYELTAELKELENKLDEWAAEHEGDVTDFPYELDMEKNAEANEEKALNIGLLIKNTEAEETALANEIRTLSQRKKTATNKIEGLKEYLKTAVPEGKKLSNSRCVISWRKSESVNVTIEPENLPENYQKIAVTADKIALKADLKAGKEVMGVSLETKQNIQIK